MKISLIIPCYNEEANLQKGVLDKIGNYTKTDSRFIEVLLVDDGSTDKSPELIGRYMKRFPKFHLVKNKHLGKAQAVITGIKVSKADHIIFSDMDLATPIEEAEKLIAPAQKEGYSIVIGSRNNNRKGAPILRKIMAYGSIILRDVLIGIKGVHDTQCGFKLFERKAALKIIERLRVYRNPHTVQGSSVSAGFDIEFLFLAVKLGYKIKEVPISWRHVETKNVRFLKDSFESLGDYIRIKYNALTGAYD